MFKDRRIIQWIIIHEYNGLLWGLFINKRIKHLGYRLMFVICDYGADSSPKGKTWEWSTLKG